jgi:FkbM family methyltransferase
MITKKVFLDCGFHHGEGLKQFVQSLKIDKAWYVVAFEANPAINMVDHWTKFNFDMGLQGFQFEHKAVWTYDGEINFSQENHFKSESGSPTIGASRIDGWASRLSFLHREEEYFEKPILVKCLDFSKYLHHICVENAKVEGYENFDYEIYCKMDIEGAEYKVLRKMLEDGTAKFIKKLWVEFHAIPGESLHSKNMLIEQLSKHLIIEEWG